ncbi:hypothetical protein BU14_0445s0003 [Porphyra umbilicalis]|uniref:Uncharacterized protein n=1 Tax=Porphyra umbilicalis TaxID=2786 RepID=A0A1X6NUN6_PORUM|nr:hypothetical protein BU14_0445s0003 [Porphyra umbilicalis]|eukprot:OSX72321.1 hypothetical protein BU14_0445s0003 [Porphyra umbilicalis]
MRGSLDSFVGSSPAPHSSHDGTGGGGSGGGGGGGGGGSVGGGSIGGGGGGSGGGGGGGRDGGSGHGGEEDLEDMDTEAFLAQLPGDGNYGTRYANSLECLQIDRHGRMKRRQMTRSQLLSEARSTLPQAVPSPKQIGDWMLAENEASAEMRAFASRVGIKSSRKGLRNYLRNALQARDIRQVDPAFTAKPALWVRHSALVISLDAVRALILHNKMFLFNPTHAAVRAAVPAIRASILSDGGMSLTTMGDGSSVGVQDQAGMELPNGSGKGGRGDKGGVGGGAAGRDGGDGGDGGGGGGGGNGSAPFELRALEGVLAHIVDVLERDWEALEPRISTGLHTLPTRLTTTALEALRVNKQALNHFHARSQKLQHVLQEVLDEDEDMANMYLTEKHGHADASRGGGGAAGEGRASVTAASGGGGRTAAGPPVVAAAATSVAAAAVAAAAAAAAATATAVVGVVPTAAAAGVAAAPPVTTTRWRLCSRPTSKS